MKSAELWELAKGVFKGVAHEMGEVKVPEDSPIYSPPEARAAAAKAFKFLFNEDFKQWSDGALGERVDPELRAVLIEVNDDPTPENGRKVEKVVQDIIDSLAPEHFEYSGFKVENPGHISDKRVRELLDGVDYLRALFKRRGMEKLLDQGVKSISLELNDPTNRHSHGLYHPHQKVISLMAQALQGGGGGRLMKDWVHEVFLHEFGHYIHLNYLSADAKEEWDSAWAPVKKMKTDQEAAVKITKGDRERYMSLLENTGWSPVAAAKKLRGIDKLKMAYWLRNPGIGGPLITPKSFRLTPKGKQYFEFLANPEASMGGEEYIERRLRAIEDNLFLVSDIAYSIPPNEVAKYVKEDPALKKVLEELETPTEYGKTNEREDFADTWVAFMDNPRALSERARTRMLRTLALSNLYGKQVLRLAHLVAAQYIDDRELANQVVRKFTAAYDPDQTMAELMAGLGMLLVQGIVVTNAFFKEDEVRKYLRIRRAYHKQFAQACSDLADAIEADEFGDMARAAVNPLRTVAGIPATQDLRALRMVARAFRGLKEFRRSALFSPQLLRLIRMSEILVRQVASEMDYSSRERLYEDYLSSLVRLPEIPAQMRTLFRKAIKYGRNVKPNESANPGAWFEMTPQTKGQIREALAKTQAQMDEVSAHYSEDPEGNREKLLHLQDKLEKIQGAAGVNTVVINKEEREPLDKVLRQEAKLEADGPTSFILEKVFSYVRAIGLRDPQGKERKNVSREVRKVLTLLGKAKTFPTVRRIIMEAIEQKVLPRYVTDDLETYLQRATKNRAVREGKKIMPLTWSPMSVEDFQATHNTGKVEFGEEFPADKREEALGKVSRALSDLEGIFGKGFCGKHLKPLDFRFGGVNVFAAASYFTWDNRNVWQPRVKFGEDYEGLLAHELGHYFEDLLSWQLSGEVPGEPSTSTSYGIPAGGGDIFGNTGTPLERYGEKGSLKKVREYIAKKMPEFVEFIDSVLSTEDYQRWCDKIGRLEDAIPGAIEELTGMNVYQLPKDHPYAKAMDAEYKSDLPPELVEAAQKRFSDLMDGDTRKLSYYQSGPEVWARMCEQYVYNKLMQAGIANPWLTQLTYDIDVMDQFMDEKTFDEKVMPVMDKIFERLGTYNIIEKQARLAARVVALYERTR